MKTLHLIRHGKSCWDNPQLADINRPLKRRGIKASKLMAEPIAVAGCDFTHVHCSSATRAQMTIARISAQLADNIDWHTDERLYTFSHDELLTWFRGIDDVQQNVVVVGHNPALTDLINELTPTSIENLPTCGYAQLRCDIDSWQQLTAGCAVLATFITPKLV